MDFALFIKAVVLGVVEGLTEFLPISSTGHLILAGSLLNFSGSVSAEKAKLFLVVIQAGAIAAVCFEFRQKIARVLSGLFAANSNEKQAAWRFASNLLIAFLPLAVLGLLFNKLIKSVLFSPVPVALAFIVGGLIIWWVEHRLEKNQITPRLNQIEDLSWQDAAKLGAAQAFALIPGTSRSGATIIGGLLFGLSRTAATEFSFFLAIPTLFAATVYELFKARSVLSFADAPLFLVGTAVSFISAFICVKWLLRYVSTHNFKAFAYYRIVFGLVVLLTAWQGWVVWAD